MKPHKHAEVLRAIADGKEAQWQSELDGSWNTPTPYNNPISDSHLNWRIKPEPKPDVSLAYFANPTIEVEEDGPLVEWTGTWSKCNLRLTFDGETGQLKSAEVLK